MSFSLLRASDRPNQLVIDAKSSYPLTPANSTLAVQDVTVAEARLFVGQLSASYLEDGFSERNSLGAAAQYMYQSLLFNPGRGHSALEVTANLLLELVTEINAVRGGIDSRSGPPGQIRPVSWRPISCWPPIYEEIPGSAGLTEKFEDRECWIRFVPGWDISKRRAV